MHMLPVVDAADAAFCFGPVYFTQWQAAHNDLFGTPCDLLPLCWAAAFDLSLQIVTCSNIFCLHVAADAAGRDFAASCIGCG